MKIDSENIINFLTKRIPELKYSLEKKNILNIEPNDSNGFGIVSFPRLELLNFPKLV